MFKVKVKTKLTKVILMVENTTAQHFPVLPVQSTGAPMTVVFQYTLYIVTHVNVVANCAINRIE